MSDVDSRGINGDVGDMDNICRDFLRNVCRRGKRCKYRHPEPGDKDMGRKTDFVFCHDFQNKECRRINCKFVHCTRSEEEYYHMTGEMPQHVQEALGISSLGSGRRGGSTGGGGLGGGVDNSDIPICKDYQKGDCRRGGRCKFRHISPNEYDMEMGGGRGVGNNGGGGGGGGSLRRYDSYGSMFNSGGGGGGIGGGSGLGGGGGGNGGGGGLYDSYEYYEPERKRRMYGHNEVGGGGGASQQQQQQQQQLTTHGTSRQPSLVPPPPLPSDYYMLEEENAFLRRRVEELKKQVNDLTATNEFLLDQNAQLRLGKQTTVAPIAQSINPNSIAPVVPPVQVSSGQMAQMTQLPVGDLAVAVPQPSCLSQELAAAAAPQTITPIVPVSMAPVSIAPVSIAQALPAASLVQSIPNPLVSYPIMTQGMRPALTPSSLNH